MMTHRREDESMDALTAENEPAPPAKLDVARSRFPFAIVWTPLPGLTWFLPFIGHMGIADSRGVIYDFAGPYTIGEDNMAFGKPVRYITLDPSRANGEGSSGAAAFDAAVARGSRDYSKRMHNLCCDNCHSHVAQCLEYMSYGGHRGWNMVVLAVWMFFAGKFVTPGRTVLAYLPFCLIAGAALLLALLR